MKKRWIAWLLAVTMCFSLLPVSVLAADGEGLNEPETEEVAPAPEQETPEEVHTHSYEAVVTEPTETEQGYTTYTCSCGDSYVTDYTEPLGTVTEEPAPEETPALTEEAVAAEVPPLMLTAGTDEGIYKDSGDGWTLTYDGVLTIYYNGDAQLDFPDRLEDRRSEITALVIEEGFEYLGEWGFHDCWALQSVSLPQSLRHMNSGFTGCTNLREITIPSGVEYICVGAFYGCTSLESVVLPSSLEAINSNTFEDCTSLKSITLPESLMYIEEGAFSGCSSLTSVTFPKNMRPIDERAFEGCSSLTAFALESGSEYCSVVDGILYDDSMYELVCCPPGKSGTVTVPESVKKIDPFAFVSCTGLTDIVLPSGLKEIPKYAFAGCSGLTGITVPSGVKTIGEDAFYGCTSLTGITLPAGVTSIGYCAFEGCSSLVNFTVPAACTDFGSDMFYGCSSLASVTFSSGVTSINGAFVDCVSLMDAVIPAGVTSIRDTFRGCSNLTTVSIPASVTEICYNSFKGCTALTTVYYGGTETQWAAIDRSDMWEDELALLNAAEIIYNVPSTAPVMGACGDDVTWTLGSDGVLTLEGSGPMWNASGSKSLWNGHAEEITSVVIGSGVTGIGERAFQDCTALASATLPSDWTSIGDEAFYGCSALKSITLPSSLTRIGDHAFSECMALENINLPEGLTSIGYQAFAYDSSLTELTIPASVTSIGELAFVNCMSLTAIDVAAGNTVYSSADGIVYNKTKTELVCCPDGRVTALTVPESVTGIGDYAFACCASLKGVTLPAGLTSVGSGAFEACYALTELTVPAGVTGIAPYTFQLCIALRRIDLPAGVAEIGNSAFYACNALADVYYGGSEEEWAAVEIGENNEPLTDAVMHFAQSDGSEIVASGTCGDFLTWTLDKNRVLTISGTGDMWDCDWEYVPSAPWSDYADSILTVVLEEGVAGIGNEAFYGCTALRSASLPASLTRIGSGAFEDCYLLKDVVIPANVASIGERAFYYCTALTAITVPDGVTSLPYGVFEGCTALKSVSIPGSVTSLGEAVFAHCTALPSVTIPVSITSIELGAFNGCTGLKNVYYDGNPAEWNAMFIGDFNDELLAAKLHCVLASGVKLFLDGEDVSGKTVFCALPDALGDGSVTIGAVAAPSGADQRFTWTCSDTKGAYGVLKDNGDGTATFTATTGKTGSVTLTAKAADGSGKSAKVTIKIGKLAGDIEITNAPTEMRGGATVTLKTNLDGDKTLTDRNVEWTLSDDSIPYATLSKNKLTTRKVFEQIVIHVTATVKARPELTQTIDILLFPETTEAHIFRNGEFMPKNTLIPVQLSEGTVQLTGSTFPTDAMQEGTWKSSSTKIATVDENGVVTLLKAGTVTITFTAADGSKKNTAVKLVIGNWVNDIAFTGLNEQGELELLSGKSATVKATIAPADATNKKLVWSSSDPTIATVSNGKVSAKTVKREETVTITATAADGSGKSNFFKVIVRPARDTLSLWDEDVDVTGKTLTIPYTEGLNCNTPAVKLYTVADGSFNESVDPADVTWKTSSAKIATVENGEVKFLKAGTVTITAVCGKLSAKLTIKAVIFTDSVSITDPQLTELVSGKNVTLKTTVLPINAANKKLVWQSSDPTVATVSNGKVTAKAVKERTDVTITATAADGSGAFAEHTFTIMPKATGITIRDNLFRVMNNRSDSISLSARPQLQLSATVFPNVNGAQQSVTWTSSNKAIAAIDENGNVTLLKKGTVTIKATAADGSKVNASFKIIVTE